MWPLKWVCRKLFNHIKGLMTYLKGKEQVITQYTHIGLISNCICVCVCETTHPWVEIVLEREPTFSLDGRIIGDLRFFFPRLSTINGFLIRKTCSVIFKSSICMDQKGNFSRTPASILTAVGSRCRLMPPSRPVERRKARIWERGRPPPPGSALTGSAGMKISTYSWVSLQENRSSRAGRLCPPPRGTLGTPGLWRALPGPAGTRQDQWVLLEENPQDHHRGPGARGLAFGVMCGL